MPTQRRPLREARWMLPVGKSDLTELALTYLEDRPAVLRSLANYSNELITTQANSANIFRLLRVIAKFFTQATHQHVD